MLMSVHCEVSLLGRKTEKHKASLQDYSIFKVLKWALSSLLFHLSEPSLSSTGVQRQVWSTWMGCMAFGEEHAATQGQVLGGGKQGGHPRHPRRAEDAREPADPAPAHHEQVPAAPGGRKEGAPRPRLGDGARLHQGARFELSGWDHTIEWI